MSSLLYIKRGKNMFAFTYQTIAGCDKCDVMNLTKTASHCSGHSWATCFPFIHWGLDFLLGNVLFFFFPLGGFNSLSEIFLRYSSLSPRASRCSILEKPICLSNNYNYRTKKIWEHDCWLFFLSQHWQTQSLVAAAAHGRHQPPGQKLGPAPPLDHLPVGGVLQTGETTTRAGERAAGRAEMNTDNLVTLSFKKHS